MADWSDIIGMDLKAARERAAKYDHDVEVMMIQEEGKEVRPGEKNPERTRPAVLVTVDGVGEDAKVMQDHRIAEPLISTKGKGAEEMNAEERTKALNYAAEILPAGVMDGQRKLLLDGEHVGHVHSQLGESTMKEFERVGISGFSVGEKADRVVARHGLDDKHLAEIGREPPTEEERRLATAQMFGMDESLFAQATPESEIISEKHGSENEVEESARVESSSENTVDGVGEDAKVLAEHRTVEAPAQNAERVPFEEVAPQLPEMTGERIRAAQEVIDAAALQTSKSAAGIDSDAAAAVFVAGNAVGQEAAASPGYAMAVARALDDDFGKGTSPHAVATSIAADMALQDHAARLLAGGSEMTDDQKAQWTSVAEGRYDGLSEGLQSFVFDNIKDEVFVSAETEKMLENFLGEEATKEEGRGTEGAEKEDDEYRPRFGAQFGRDEEELEDGGRPSGFTFNPVEEPSLASKNEHDAAFVGADLRSVLNDPDLPEVFEGKTITVTLGFDERYVFDGDRIHNSLANGEWNVPGGFPENVFVAREGDPMKDPKHAWKMREQQLEYGMRAVAALSSQAKTEIDHRSATGGLEPTPACEHIEAFYGESRAAIIAERMDTLSNADLKALSEMNLKKLSQAAVDMLVEGRHTEGPEEEVRRDRGSLSPHVSTSVGKDGGFSEGGLAEASVVARPRSNEKVEHEIDLAAGLKAVSQSPMTAVEFVRSKGVEDMDNDILVHAMTRGGAER